MKRVYHINMSYRKDKETKAILLTRVSTEEQGNSRNGLDAQKKSLEEFCSNNGIEIIAHYEEISSGKFYELNKRPVLNKALQHATKAKALVLVSKIDRLSRDVELIAHLMNRGVRFASVEAGLNATAFEIQLRATFASEERRKISERTKAALQVVKAKGTKLGNPNWNKSIDSAREARTQKTLEFVKEKEDYIVHLRAQGKSFSAIANQLNKENVSTQRGGRWYPTTVKNLLDRATALRDANESQAQPSV